MHHFSLAPLSLGVLLALAGCGDVPVTAPRSEFVPFDAPVEVSAPTAEQHYAVARDLEAAGRPLEAAAELDRAIALGAGRDARLLAAKLAILRDDLEAAALLLTALTADDPADPTVRYNLGLIAQRRNEYNRARNEYLAALHADPRHLASRHNLALLAWEAGVKEEARHHARKLLALAPADPRAVKLRNRFDLDADTGPEKATVMP
jgi:tetratricopeptide (TPR) repeat protein